MSERERALDQGFQTGIATEDEQIVLTAYQDVEPHLEYAANVRRVDAEERGAFGARADFHRTMAVPFNVIMEVAQRLQIAPARIFETECQRRIYRELKGPDYKRFRTTIDKRI